MKKTLALMMALVLLLSTVQIALAKEEVAYTGTVAGGSLHMRKEPSPSGKVIQTYKSGTKVDILENDGTWCKVQIGEKTGYLGNAVLGAVNGLDAALDKAPDMIEKIKGLFRKKKDSKDAESTETTVVITDTAAAGQPTDAEEKA